MNVKLYGTALCSRCKTARMMLEKRNLIYEYYDADYSEDLPILVVDDETFSAKDALWKIRELGCHNG